MPMPASAAHTIASSNSIMMGLWRRTIAATTTRNASSSSTQVKYSIIFSLSICGRFAPRRYPAAGRRLSRHAGHGGEVLNRRKRVVEVVKQAFPFVVSRRSTEPDRMVFQLIPADQEYVPGRGFDAAVQFVRPVAAHRGNDRLRLFERRLEFQLATGNYLEDRDFENHELNIEARG